MSIQPIKLETFKFKKIPKLYQRSLIGFDKGCSLTKIIFVAKRDEHEILNDEIENVTFQYAIFSNDKVEESLKWVKERAYRDEKNNYPIHITGVGAFKYKKLIEDLFCCETEVIAEELSIVAGIKYSLENVGEEQMRYPPTSFSDQGKIESDMIEKFIKSMKNKFKDSNYNEDNLFPCIVHVCGSAAANYYFDENGKGSVYGFLFEGGKTFLGLCKSLIDTNDYNEIVDLASKGIQQNVDTIVKEVLTDDPNSPYGRFPPYHPILSFGKCMDLNIGQDELSREDIAAAIVALKSFCLINSGSMISLIKKFPKIYLLGNIFQSNIFQLHAEKLASMFPIGSQLVFLNMGFFCALGALMTKNTEKSDYYYEQ